MEEDNLKNGSSSKRLANAKKKLQEYKNQKRLEEAHGSVSAAAATTTTTVASTAAVEKDTVSVREKLEDKNWDGPSDSLTSSLDNSSSTRDQLLSTSENGSQEDQFEIQTEESAVTTPSLPSPIVSPSTESIPEFTAPPAQESAVLSIQEVVTPVPETKEMTERATQCEAEEDKEKTDDVIESLHKNVFVLRKENEVLVRREVELVQQLEASEKLIRDLRKEVNQFKEQGNVHQQLEDLQSAMVVVSKSKMGIAEELSNEQDKNKELLTNLGTYENELQSLRTENGKLWAEINSLKTRLEEELMRNHILEDQQRHFSNQVETLQAKLQAVENEPGPAQQHSITPLGNTSSESEHSHSHHDEGKCSEDHRDHDHGPHLPNGHEDCAGHDHAHDHHGHHDHSHELSHSNHSSVNTVDRRLLEMEKTLKRMEWENKTYEEELMKLAPLKNLQPQCEELKKRNKDLKEELERVEHLVIQLQGENDTIGDYITLYQTQKLALRQHAKENAQLVEALSREKNELVQKLSELSHAVEKLATAPHGQVLESEIRDLIVDVNTKVHEPYTCSVCSGSRLMTV